MLSNVFLTKNYLQLGPKLSLKVPLENTALLLVTGEPIAD